MHCGYKQRDYNKMNLKYKSLVTSNTKQKRHRYIVWFNSPFSANISTNVAKTFLQLLDKNFPPSNSLQKTFNRTTRKTAIAVHKFK